MKLLKNIVRQAIAKGVNYSIEIGFCFGLFALFQQSEICQKVLMNQRPLVLQKLPSIANVRVQMPLP
jgi:hypothetical protein